MRASAYRHQTGGSALQWAEEQVENTLVEANDESTKAIVVDRQTARKHLATQQNGGEYSFVAH